MKTKKNTTMPMQLPGALALAAAGAATQANAATVQITFTGSYLSTTGGNHLVTDFGGDLNADINVPHFKASWLQVGAVGGGRLAYIRDTFSSGYHYVNLKIGNQGNVLTEGNGPTSRTIRNFTTATFTDGKILGGQSFQGYLDITASATMNGAKQITVNRLIFDDVTGGTISGLNVNAAAYSEYTPTAADTSAVPEASTSLGLLALGAGGLLTRRRTSRKA